MRWRMVLEVGGADGTRQVHEVGAGERPPAGQKIRIITQVPEPMSLALFGMGLAGLGMMRRRKAA